MLYKPGRHTCWAVLPNSTFLRGFLFLQSKYEQENCITKQSTINEWLWTQSRYCYAPCCSFFLNKYLQSEFIIMVHSERAFVKVSYSYNQLSIRYIKLVFTIWRFKIATFFIPANLSGEFTSMVFNNLLFYVSKITIFYPIGSSGFNNKRNQIL